MDSPAIAITPMVPAAAQKQCSAALDQIGVKTAKRPCSIKPTSIEKCFYLVCLARVNELHI